MSKKKHKLEESVSKLRHVDVLTAQGTPVADAIRIIGVTEVSSGTNCSTGGFYSLRARSSSRAGASTTTPSGLTPRWATGRLLPRHSCPLWRLGPTSQPLWRRG